jgi:hypothetical protein
LSRIAAGFRLREVPATNAGIVAWAIGFELNNMAGTIAILTPDSSYHLLRTALEKVRTNKFNLNKVKGTTFGPFPSLKWRAGDDERASSIIGKLQLTEVMSYTDAISALTVCASDTEIIETTRRLERFRRITGLRTVSRSELEELIQTATRDISRYGRTHSSNIEVMTVHAAKNQEFENVLVLWPHTAPADPNQARRLLYNAITRARRHCSVVVFGKDRLAGPPFSM